MIERNRLAGDAEPSKGIQDAVEGKSGHVPLVPDRKCVAVQPEFTVCTDNTTHISRIADDQGSSSPCGQVTWLSATQRSGHRSQLHRTWLTPLKIVSQSFVYEQSSRSDCGNHVANPVTQAITARTRPKWRQRLGACLLQRAADLVRATGDPAMFLRAATALLSLSGDEALLAEAQAKVQAIVQALPNEDLISCFLGAEIVRPLLTSTMPRGQS